MAKRKKQDPGLTYLKRIGFNRIRGTYGLEDRLVRTYGPCKAMQLLKEYESIPMGDYIAIGNFIHSSFEMCTAFAEASQGDLIRNACNYIAENSKYMGKDILEVGCGGGYITGFLALTFPQSTIYAIDRNEKALEITRQRLSKLGVSNVVFKHTDLLEIEESFDTIVLVHAAAENSSSPFRAFIGLPANKLLEHYYYEYELYLSSCKARLKDKGHIISFDESDIGPMLASYVNVLRNKQCGLILESHKRITCQFGCDQMADFHVMVFENNSILEESALSSWWTNQIVEEQKLHTGPIFKDWYASLTVRENAADLIKGVYVFSKTENKMIGKSALYHVKDNKNLLIHYICNYAIGQELQYGQNYQKDLALKQIDEFIRINSQTNIVREFTLKDGEEIIGEICTSL